MVTADHYDIIMKLLLLTLISYIAAKPNMAIYENLNQHPFPITTVIMRPLCITKYVSMHDITL